MVDAWTPLPARDPGIDEPFESDLPCRSCGYNLRGLLPSGRCPECGTAIGFSLHGDLLKFSDPNWVETLASGMNWIIAGLVVSLVLGVAVVVAGSAAHGGAITAASILSHLVSLIGYWKVTTPDPSQTEASGLNVRLAARFGWITASVLSAAHTAVDIQEPWARLGLLVLLLIASLGSIVSICVYAAGLALRIPDLRLSQQTHTVMWGFVLLEAASLGAVLIVTMAGGGPRGGGGAAAIMAVGLSCFSVLGLLIFGIWAIVLLVKYRRAMSLAAAEARATWAAHAAEGDRAEVTKDGADRNALSVE